jgi:hypothetical protein
VESLGHLRGLNSKASLSGVVLLIDLLESVGSVKDENTGNLF